MPASLAALPTAQITIPCFSENRAKAGNGRKKSSKKKIRETERKK